MKKRIVLSLLTPSVIGAIFFGRLLYTSSTLDPSQLKSAETASAAVSGSAHANEIVSPSPPQVEPVVEKPFELPAFTTELPYGKLISRIEYPNHEKTVYLTFDDGPGDATGEIVRILDKNKINGSFFWIGHNLITWLEKDPNNQKFAQDMLKKGDVIGSHTMNHTSMAHKSVPIQTQIIKENADLLTQKTGQPVTYFRPPYGATDANTLKICESEKEVLAYWKVDSEDWKYPNHPDKVLNNIMTEVEPGAIILLHEKLTTAAMLQNIIDKLKEKGYEFAPLPTVKNGKQ